MCSASATIGLLDFVKKKLKWLILVLFIGKESNYLIRFLCENYFSWYLSNFPFYDNLISGHRKPILFFIIRRAGKNNDHNKKNAPDKK